jgi:hypothetical protein
MPTDFDPLTVPKVMDQSVRRTLPDGRPAQALLDYEQQLQAWMKANVANTNTRLTTVEETAGSANAAVIVEANARATADSAMATQITTLTSSIGTVSANLTTESTTRATADTALSTTITTVNASIDDQMANGAVKFTAVAAPGGAAAAYEIQLTASGYLAGLQVLADTTYGGSIGMRAHQFTFVDSGTATRVLYYSGGAWNFYSTVVIHGNLIVDGTINNAEMVNNAITQVAWAVGSSSPVGVGITIRQSAYLVIRGSSSGGSVGGVGSGTVTLYSPAAGNLRVVSTPAYVSGYSIVEGISYPVSWAVPGGMAEYVWGPLSAGGYTFYFYGVGELTLIVEELAK